MEPIRRQQLIEATISSIGRHGLADTTVARIGAAAGLSTGIIHHYFGDKDGLLEATLRSLIERLRQEVVARLRRAETPRQRLDAIIAGNLAPEQFDPDSVAGWLALWVQSAHDPALARLRRVNTRRLRSNLRHPLRRMLPAAEVEPAALAVAALIDGLWLHAALSAGNFDLQTAHETVNAVVERLLLNSPATKDPRP